MEFKDRYAFLSNMYSCSIHYNGEIFPCVETAFQYAKTGDRSLFTNDRGYFVSGYTARKIGRSCKLPESWNEDRIVVMYELLEDKFYHNEKLRQALKDTGDIYLQEDNTWGDKFWGVCNDEGCNMLGKMLMEIRQNIQNEDRKTMKVIVAGGRDFNDYNLLSRRLDFYFANIKPIIVCGEAKGADTLGKKYALEHGYEVISMPADWSKGKDAGYIRNAKMAGTASAAVIFWNGISSGSKHMIDVMNELGKPVKVVKYA